MKRFAVTALAALSLLAPAHAVRAADKTPLANYGGGAIPLKAGDTVPVANGGTGASVLTSHCVLVGAGTSAAHLVCPSSSGYVLTDNGAGSDPSFQAAAGGGTPGGSSGQIQYNNAGAFAGSAVSGDCTAVILAFTCAKLNGVSPGYFFSGTDAANLTGTLALARLGSQSANVVLAGPNGSSGTPSFRALVGADLPNPSSSTLGGIESLASVSHRWINTISTSGVPSATQPACGDLSDAAALCNSTDAANLTGTVSVNRFNSGTSASTSTWLRGDGTWVTPTAVTSCANPCVIGSAYVRSGSGVPSPSDPTGSVYFRTDTGWTYQRLPTVLAPSRVQDAVANGTKTVTLSTAPALNDLLVGYCSEFNNNLSAGSGWTSVTTHSTGVPSYAILVYKFAGASESTSQTPCGGAATIYSAVEVIEVANTGLTWANTFDTVTFADRSGTTATATHSTSTDNSLAIGFSGWNIGAPVDVVTLASGGWSNTTFSPTGSGSSSGSSSTSIGMVTSQSVATASTSITEQTSVGASSGGLTNALLILKPPGGAYTGWQQLSGLITFKNGGVNLETEPRSFNCSTNLTCTTNGLGDITIVGNAGTVTTTGSPASGELVKFSGASSVTNGNLSGDCTTTDTLAITCTKYNSGTSFGTFAGQNYATPPAIGGTTPAAGAFTTGSFTGNLTTNITGSTQCLHANSSGVVSGTGSDCGSGGGGGTVNSVATNAPWTSGGPITTSGTIDVGAVVKANVAASIMTHFGGL